jgi:putative oxidoreductase
MERSRDAGLLFIRVAFGLLVAIHGLGKLPHFQELVHLHGDTVAALMVAGELGGGVGIALGLLTRVAGLGMAVAMWITAFHLELSAAHHVGTPAGVPFEFPFLLGAFGFGFFLIGSGQYSIDAKLFNAK